MRVPCDRFKIIKLDRSPPLYLHTLNTMKESIFPYELFRLDAEELDRLQQSDTAEDMTTLGMWHIITVPDDDYISQAETLFRKAIAKGSALAKLQLANMYRLGDFGLVDMKQYIRLRDESIAEGCQMAQLRLCRDIAYGVGCLPDLDMGIAETKRRLAAIAYPDPRWYDALGWMLMLKGAPSDESNGWFLKAIECGYIDSYSGLVDMPEAIEMGRKEGCGGCCIMIAGELVKKYHTVCENDANATDYFSDTDEKSAYLEKNSQYKKELAQQIVSLYQEATRLGETAGYYYLGQIYYGADLGHMEDDDKAWHYFMTGARMGHCLCLSMLAEMIEEGRASEEYQWEDACLYRLKALRYGDDNQLLYVVHDYHEGELEDYAEEIVRDYIPRYDALPDEEESDVDGEDDCQQEDGEADDDPEDDDGRFDAWA